MQDLQFWTRCAALHTVHCLTEAFCPRYLSTVPCVVGRADLLPLLELDALLS